MEGGLEVQKEAISTSKSQHSDVFLRVSVSEHTDCPSLPNHRGKKDLFHLDLGRGQSRKLHPPPKEVTRTRRGKYVLLPLIKVY